MTDVRVALDGRRVQDRPLGGVGRSIARMLPGIAARTEAVVLTDASRVTPDAIPGLDVVSLPRRRGMPEATWLHGPARAWARRHPHVFHGTFNAVPFGLRGPAVVTIWDLTFELHPEDFDSPRRRAMRQWFRLNARWAARHCDVVLTGSRFSADVIVDHYGLARDRVRVIPCAADPLFTVTAAARAPTVAARHGIRPPYAIAVGGAPRRGAATAVAAWAEVRRRGVEVDLVLLGGDDIEPQPGLHQRHGLADDEWTALLAGAEVLCYPTRYEGFGLPALEAIASGTPVVAAPTSSLPEVLGDAARWCDDTGVEAIAEGLEDVLVDASLRASLRERGLARVAASPTWDDIATLHAEVYAEVAS